MIVIAIIGILFVVLVSKVDFATDKAKDTGVQTDFRSFQVAIETVIKELTAFSFFSANGWRSGGALRSICGTEDYARVDTYSGSVSGRTQSPNSSSWAYGAFVIG